MENCEKTAVNPPNFWVSVKISHLLLSSRRFHSIFLNYRPSCESGKRYNDDLVCFDLNKFIKLFSETEKQKNYFVISLYFLLFFILRHHDVKAQWFSIRPCLSHSSNDYLSLAESFMPPSSSVEKQLSKTRS